MEASQSGAAPPQSVEGAPEGAAPGSPEAQTPENQGVNAQNAAAAHAAEQAQGAGADAPESAPQPGEEGYEAAEEREAEAIEGGQGREALEQDALGVADNPDAVIRQSSPPASAQGGVPLESDREAGVKPGPAVPEPGSGAQPAE